MFLPCTTLPPWILWLQLDESNNSLCSSTPLETLRTTVLPSTTLPPWFLKICLKNTLQQYRHIKAYHFFFVLQFFFAFVCSCLAPLYISFHLLLLCFSHALRFSYSLLFSPFLLCQSYILHLCIVLPLFMF
jgi:hypothetical protein